MALVEESEASDTSAALTRLPVRSEGRYERLVKPVMDRVLAVGLLFALAPVLALVALGVLLTMGRPVLFRQERLGKGAVPFEMLKFRSMLPDRRMAQVPFEGPDRRTTHKTDADPRHTRFGRFLRRTSLDELPQLVNVIRGEMSLVGPRPELPGVAARHELTHHVRHTVKPGITGPWQISPNRTEFIHEHVELDEAYVQSVTLGGDLAILGGTVRSVAGRPLRSAKA